MRGKVHHYIIYGYALMLRGGDQNLFQGGDTRTGAVKRDHAERFHALADGNLAHFTRAGTTDDQFANLVGNSHHFNDRHAPGITGIFATLAAAPAKKLGALKHGGINPEIGKHFGRITERLLAMRTDAAHETLRAG